MSELPVYFNIALGPQKESEQWAEVAQRFSQTLNSVLRQTDHDFRVFVAAHEVPDLPLLRDPRVDLEILDRPKPRDRESARRDKIANRQANFRRIAAHGDGYTILLDADDLVGNRLVEFLHRFNAQHGYVFWGGYVYDSGRKRVARLGGLTKLSNICGSCAAIRFKPSDYRGDPAAYATRLFGNPGGHPTWEQTARREGRPLSSVLRPLVTYVIHDFQLSLQYLATRNDQVAAAMDKFAVEPGDEWREEFGLNY
jgi:hypothetical protein